MYDFAYCLIELEYARMFGKRLVHIKKIVISNTLEQALAAGEQQVMVNFYKLLQFAESKHLH
ncbi:MAG TPA: hypothetical protein ENG03_11105, partial [Thioploca sp.]|nr:hypothetical protein [Thioploca sp.]